MRKNAVRRGILPVHRDDIKSARTNWSTEIRPDLKSTSDASQKSDTYGGSPYGDYGVYTPKGSSGTGSASASASSGGKSKTKSGNKSSSTSNLSSDDAYDSYESSASSPSSSASSSSYGSGTYLSEWGATPKTSRFQPNFTIPSLQVSLLPAILLILFITLVGMLITAHQMEHSPEGTFANCCRVSLATVSCICKVMYNLYHCRLGDIPQVVFASDFEDDEELTDQDLERMKLRPGIERALDVEHRKALRKVGIEMKRIKVVKGTQKEKNKEGLSRAADSSRV
eukprot:CCRYP_013887-RA/>CCRYP_013887-RA protein AED:0.03 eAED:0.03 QI:186/1/1/1/0/0/2/101/282